MDQVIEKKVNQELLSELFEGQQKKHGSKEKDVPPFKAPKTPSISGRMIPTSCRDNVFQERKTSAFGNRSGAGRNIKTFSHRQSLEYYNKKYISTSCFHSPGGKRTNGPQK